MKRRMAAILAIGLALISTSEIIAQNRSNSTDPKRSRLEDQADETNPAEQAILSDINSIRSRFGGGIANRFMDLSDEGGKRWQQQANREFERELRRLAAADFRDDRNPGTRHDGTEGLAEKGSPIQSDRRSRSEQSLRNAARSMEEIAARFEEIGLYTDADEIRRQAGEFWIRAREMGQPNKPTKRREIGPIRDTSSEN